MKKILCVLLSLVLLVSLFAGCEDKVSAAMDAASNSETAGSVTIEDLTSGANTTTTETMERAEEEVKYDSMTMDELYELAKAEGGVINIYATTTDAQTAVKKFQKAYPDLEALYVGCDTNTVGQKIELEAESGNITADIMLVKDASGEIFNEMVLPGLVQIYMPEAIVSHIDPELLKYGLPLYAAFNPWYYNNEMYPDGSPINNWWDIVEGYNEDTASFIDASGNNTQKWTIFTKDVTGPSYASLWAQLIIDADQVEEAYKAKYGKDIVYTYTAALSNQIGVMELPENNAGVELFYRFIQMKMTELADGDGVVDAVDQSLAGPTLGLTSASKLSNADQGMHIAWVTGLAPYTGLQACSYLYVVNNCDNPAGARLFINFMLGGEDGQSGCYSSFDKKGAWSIRDDVVFEKSSAEFEELGLCAPNFTAIYSLFPNVTAYWTYWRSLATK